MISRLRPLRLQALRLTRPYSTTKPSNPTTQFYKTFTRPVFKVILTAVFTYQVVYWSWLKLEADEKRAETDAEIRDLEKTVNEYESKRKEKK